MISAKRAQIFDNLRAYKVVDGTDSSDAGLTPRMLVLSIFALSHYVDC